LPKLQGSEVEICPASSLEVVHIATQSILDIGEKKDERESLRLEIVSGGVARTLRTTCFSRVRGTWGSETQSLATPSTMPLASSPFFVPRFIHWGTTFY
jgi:hypothetical protein